MAPLLPSTFGKFHEPFMGGAALFFHLRATREPFEARLSDGNERLVRAYRGVRDDVEGVIRQLQTYPHDKDFYLDLRAKKPEELSEADAAAWLIYLNRTCFNGLYRVNSKNEFNVPFGRYENPNICDAKNLRACSRALRGVEVVEEDFATAAEQMAPDDLVYFDPPYVPVSASSSFTSYTAGGFGPNDQTRLRDVALGLARRGVHVLLSNSDTPDVRKLYSDFRITEVSANRALNSKTTGRGAVGEVLISWPKQPKKARKGRSKSG